MRNTLTAFALAWLAMLSQPALAEKADRTKPMNIEADALRYDDVQQVSVFTGRVVMTKGTITVRGARLEVRQDADGYQYSTVTVEPGARAFFRQKRDGPGDEWIEGEGERIEYDGRSDVAKFITRAEMRRLRGSQLNDQINGAVITYDNVRDVYNVDGGAPRGEAPAVAGTGGGRVRAMLGPKTPAAPATDPAPAPTLRGSTTLPAGARP